MFENSPSSLKSLWRVSEEPLLLVSMYKIEGKTVFSIDVAHRQDESICTEVFHLTTDLV